MKKTILILNLILLLVYFSYTSIGDRTNTLPNPYLKQTNVATGKDEYLHANQLDGDEYERAGRL